MESCRAQPGLPALNHLLQHTLRSMCTDSQWVYAVFWRILPRNYPPPRWDTEGGVMDRSKGNKRNWILVWEDGFCNFSACAGAAKEQTRAGGGGAGAGSPFFAAQQQQQHRGGCGGSDDESEAMNPELFFKMSHEVYNYGEGLMGKVAADSSHKWVYREPMEHEISFLSPWHGSLDPHPRTWEAQFKSGIQTIAVVAVQEGVLQLGSTKKIMEDLNFVLHMQRKFNYLQSIPGVFVPHPVSGGGGRKRGGEGSAPAERGHWMAAAECEPLTAAGGGHLTARSIDQFLSPRLGPNVWRSASDTSILGVKRPPDGELNFKEYSYKNGGYECRPECPSPPKALNTGQTSPQGGASPTLPNLLPSMSSLQALLSKLPSVTPAADGESNGGGGATGSPPRSNGFDGGAGGCFTSNWPPIRRSAARGPERAGPLREAASSGGGGNGHLRHGGAPSMAPDGEGEGLHQQQHGACGGGAAAASPPSSGSDVVSGGEFPDDAEAHTSPLKDNHPKYTSFLDTFDNLPDFGLHDALENNDSYSFLNEIYS